MDQYMCHQCGNVFQSAVFGPCGLCHSEFVEQLQTRAQPHNVPPRQTQGGIPLPNLFVGVNDDQGQAATMTSILRSLFTDRPGVHGENAVRFEFSIEPNGPMIRMGGNADIEQVLNDLWTQASSGSLNSRGLSDAEISGLPIAKVSQKHVDNQTQCSTCFDNFVLGENVTELTCKHIFHKPCVDPWLKQQRTCPVCRQRVETILNRSRNAPPPRSNNNSQGAASNAARTSQPYGMMDIDELD